MQLKTNPSFIGPGSSAPADNWSRIWITVTLRDSSGNPVPGKYVSLKTNNGNGTLVTIFGPPVATLSDSAGNVRTEQNGVAQFNVVSGTPYSAVPLVAVDVTDSIQLINLAVVTFTPVQPVATPNPPAAVDPSKSNIIIRGVQLASSPSYISPGSSAPADNWSRIWITVTLLDSSGKPVPGKYVSLKTHNGNSTPVTIFGPPVATLSDSAGNVRTEQNGVAQFNVVSGTPYAVVPLVAEDVTDSIQLINLAVVTFTPAQPAATPSPRPVATPSPQPPGGAAACKAHPMEEIVDEPQGRFFCFAGLNLRVDSIQTFDKAAGSPLLTKNLNTSADPDLGYIVVKVTMQNRNSSRNQNIPGNMLGFDLANGSKIDVDNVNASYAGANLDDPPDSLRPGETLQITYVVVNWNRSPVRTIYIKRNVGNEQNDPGVQYARFFVKP